MRAGALDRQVILGPDRELVAVGLGKSGGADHQDGMVGLRRRLGVALDASLVWDARVDPCTVEGTTLHDHREKGPHAGTTFALTRRAEEFSRPIDLQDLVDRPGRSSLFRAGEDPDHPTGLVTAWLDDALVVVAHGTRYRDHLVEIEASLRRGSLALIRPDVMHGPFLVIADRLPDDYTISSFKAEADRNLSDWRGSAYEVPTYQVEFGAEQAFRF